MTGTQMGLHGLAIVVGGLGSGYLGVRVVAPWTDNLALLLLMWYIGCFGFLFLYWFICTELFARGVMKPPQKRISDVS